MARLFRFIAAIWLMPHYTNPGFVVTVVKQLWSETA